MKPAALSDLAKELKSLSPNRVFEIAVRLAKYKKENKELLTYLLFESGDEESYIRSVKQMVDELFTEINHHSLHYVKKTLRKILRLMNKNIKYSGIKQTEIELRIYFCSKIKEAKIAVRKNKVLLNLYLNQLKKIDELVSKLHEDLQFDYVNEIKDLAL